MYDFDSIRTTWVDLPYRTAPYLKVLYEDPALAGYEVHVIADSRNHPGPDERNRLTTVVGRFPRCVLAEVNTHRVFSRNSASSRARSLRATVSSVMEDPYVPLFTQNQRGMSGRFLPRDKALAACEVWLEARDCAVSSSLHLLTGTKVQATRWQEALDTYYGHYRSGCVPADVLSVHKQNANRLLEPWMWHEAVITSDKWENFLHLRTDLDSAQPEIYAFALLVQRALEVSEPQRTWLHLPFAAQVPQQCDDLAQVWDTLMLSATDCAKVSYRDRARDTGGAAASTALGLRLLKDGHLSPFEHVAFSREGYLALRGSKDSDEVASNFSGRWVQLRPVAQAAADRMC